MDNSVTIKCKYCNNEEIFYYSEKCIECLKKDFYQELHEKNGKFNKKTNKYKNIAYQIIIIITFLLFIPFLLFMGIKYGIIVEWIFIIYGWVILFLSEATNWLSEKF